MATELPVLVDGETVYIEMEAAYGSEETGFEDAAERTINAFEQAKSAVVHVSSGMVKAIQSMDAALTPDDFTLQFGIKFKVDGTVVVASVGSEAALTITMVYRHKKANKT